MANCFYPLAVTVIDKAVDELVSQIAHFIFQRFYFLGPKGIVED